MALAVALVVLAASLPLWGESSWMREFVEIACYFIFAMMWNLLAGYGGMVSIGQQAFFGLGGYAMLVLGNFAGINPVHRGARWAAIAAALVAVPVSLVAFRLQGGYFAIGTWVIAEVFRLSIANVSAVGGGSGTSLTALRGIEKATRERVTYWLALACVVAAIALVYLFLRASAAWRCWRSATTRWRPEPGHRRARARSSRSTWWRRSAPGWRARSISSATCASARRRIHRELDRVRDLHRHDRRHRPHRRADHRRADLLPAQQVPRDYGTWYLIGLGLLAIVVTIFFKQGLWGFAQQRWGWSLFPTQRRLVTRDATAPKRAASLRPSF